MKLTWIWIVSKITNFFLPLGFIPMVYCTVTHPLTILLWMILGAAGFAFGLMTWKYHVSRRDYWALSSMKMLGWKIRSAFRRLWAFCCTGASICALFFLFS